MNEQLVAQIQESLMHLRDEVSNLKARLTYFEQARSDEKKDTEEEIRGVTVAYKNAVNNVEEKFMEKIGAILKTIDSVNRQIRELQESDTKKAAAMWNKIVALLVTAVSGAVVAKLPDIIKLIAG